MRVPDSTPRGGDGGNGGGLFDPGANNLQFNYVMLLVSLAFGITALVAVVLAYVCRGQRGDWVESHYQYQIGTFWLGLFYAIVAALTSVIGIGLLLFPLLAVWLVVRCVKGLKRVTRAEPIDNPGTWLW